MAAFLGVYDRGGRFQDRAGNAGESDLNGLGHKRPVGELEGVAIADRPVVQPHEHRISVPDHVHVQHAVLHQTPDHQD